MSKVIKTEKAGFKFEWQNGEKGSRETLVKAFDSDGKEVLDWAFPNLAHGLLANVTIYEDQAVLYAKRPQKS